MPVLASGANRLRPGPQALVSLDRIERGVLAAGALVHEHLPSAVHDWQGLQQGHFGFAFGTGRRFDTHRRATLGRPEANSKRPPVQECRQPAWPAFSVFRSRLRLSHLVPVVVSHRDGLACLVGNRLSQRACDRIVLQFQRQGHDWYAFGLGHVALRTDKAGAHQSLSHRRLGLGPQPVMQSSMRPKPQSNQHYFLTWIGTIPALTQKSVPTQSGPPAAER